MKVLFVCHGNICRSPMAEFIMKDLLKKAGISNVQVDSVAASIDFTVCIFYAKILLVNTPLLPTFLPKLPVKA